MSKNEIIAGLRFEAMQNEALALLLPGKDYLIRAQLFEAAADVIAAEEPNTGGMT